MWIGGIEFRLGVQQHVGFLRYGKRCLHVGARLGDQVRANRVGRFRQVTELGARLFGDPLRGSMQLRRLGMLRCRVTQQHGAVVASHQARGDGHCHIRSGNRFETAGAAISLAFATATTTSDKAASQSLGARIILLAMVIS